MSTFRCNLEAESSAYSGVFVWSEVSVIQIHDYGAFGLGIHSR